MCCTAGLAGPEFMREQRVEMVHDHVACMWCSYFCHHCATIDASINARTFASTPPSSGAGDIAATFGADDTAGTFAATAAKTGPDNIAGAFAATAPSTGAGNIAGTFAATAGAPEHLNYRYGVKCT